MSLISIEAHAAHFSIGQCENKNIMYVKYDNDNSNILLIQDEEYVTIKNKSVKEGYFYKDGKLNKVTSYSLDFSSDKSEGLLIVKTSGSSNTKILPINQFEVPINNCPIYKNFNRVFK